jgi:predicted nucleic acid-binding protein
VTLVVDASVAAKWVLPEPDSERATVFRNTEPNLIAPQLIVAEIGNAVWKRARRGELTVQDATEAVATAVGIIGTLYRLEDLVARATEIAIALDHPIYDCFYLALAERESAPLITADRRLSTVATRLGTVEIATL